MKILYKATAVSTGGRDGQVYVENSPLRFEMATPPELKGTKPNGFNPEQLFAAGYSACFGGALQHFIRLRNLSVDAPQVRVTVGLGRKDEGGNKLAVDIVAVFHGLTQEAADSLVADAHQICPYSDATRGNIDVSVLAKVE